MNEIPSSGFYVYTLARPNLKVFYVGKGCGKRIYQHEREARGACRCHRCNVIRKIWRDGGEVVRSIVFTTSDETAAYDYEQTLIARIGLKRLTNHMLGNVPEVVQRPTLPDRPIYEITEREYTSWLENRGADRDLIDKEIDRLRTRKLLLLQSLIKSAKGRQRNGYDMREKIAYYERLMEEIWIAYGFVRQEKLEGLL